MKRAGTKWAFMAVVFVVNLLSAQAWGEKNIGVLLWSDEARYHETTAGIMDQLKKEGFKEPAVRFTIENARGSKARMAELAHKFAAAKMDMVVSVGTTATLAATKEIKEVPIVFGYVYDSVKVNIAQSWKSSGNNSTGASSKVPMTRLVSTLKKFAPVKRLAVLYTPGEKNSEAELRELQGVQADAGIRVIPVIVPTEEEVAHILPEVTRMADAIYLSGSSVVGNKVSLIVDMATRAGVVTITHLEDLVDKGVLLGVCADSYQVGRLAGRKAAKILKGAKPSSIPIEYEKNPVVILNMRTATAGQFQIPSSFPTKATRRQ